MQHFPQLLTHIAPYEDFRIIGQPEYGLIPVYKNNRAIEVDAEARLVQKSLKCGFLPPHLQHRISELPTVFICPLPLCVNQVKIIVLHFKSEHPVPGDDDIINLNFLIDTRLRLRLTAAPSHFKAKVLQMNKLHITKIFLQNTIELNFTCIAA